MRSSRREHAAGPVLASRREGSDLVTGAEQLLDMLSADLLQRDHVGVKPAQRVPDDDTTSVPSRVRWPKDVERHAAQAPRITGHAR